LIEGGNGCGYVIEIPGIDEIIYYAGDTNIFSDMKIINDLYEPTIGFLPIGGKIGMGAKECSYAIREFLPNLRQVIPMCFNIVPGYPTITARPDRL
jgi:L-ascorbate metabolism protein UlaG (beta-lactamase superfamily)